MTVAANYFRTAAANLQQAAVAKQQEIAQARTDIDSYIRQTNQEVEHLRQEIANREHLIAADHPEERDPHNRQRSELLREVQQLQGEITRKEHEINHFKEQKNAEISRLENDMRDAQQKAQSFANKQ